MSNKPQFSNQRRAKPSNIPLYFGVGLLVALIGFAIYSPKKSNYEELDISKLKAITMKQSPEDMVRNSPEVKRQQELIADEAVALNERTDNDADNKANIERLEAEKAAAIAKADAAIALAKADYEAKSDAIEQKLEAIRKERLSLDQALLQLNTQTR